MIHLLLTGGSAGASMPAVNVRESNDDFVIEVAAPGMKRNDFNVALDNNLLTISSRREENSEEKGLCRVNS